MSFQPVLPLSGYAGWGFLQRTRVSQQTTQENTPAQQRDTTYFRKNIGNISTAEDLVNDRRLLKVALGAFGLDGDLDNRFFVKKVLEDGTIESGALANRLSDKRYLAFSKAFGFGDFPIPNTQLSDFANRITAAYSDRQFEIAVGTNDENFRLALGLKRELGDLATRQMSGDAMWFTIMGTPPLRTVFETAFGLPASFGALDIDRQLKVFKEKSDQAFNTTDISAFAEPAKQEDLIRRFLLRAELRGQSQSLHGGQAALTLLQNAFGPASVLS